MKLDQYDLTKDLILEGEYPEFTPVKSAWKEKRPVYLGEVVDTVVQAAFADLEELYRENDVLLEENTQYAEQLLQTENALHAAQAQAAVKSEDEAKLKQVENLFADLETTISNYKKKRAEDAQMINDLQHKLSTAVDGADIERLQGRIRDLEQMDSERESAYQDLADDVNAVLDGLSERFESLSA